MSGFRALAALAWRESRFARRRLLLFLSSISLGVAALVATQSFAANLSQGIHDQSRALLGADLAFNANRAFGPKSEEAIGELRRRGYPIARQTNFGSMALLERTGATRLTQVHAVDPGYPFYGTVETEPAGRWAALQSGQEALADPALLTALDARVGDSISLGDLRFRAAGTVARMPGAVGIGSLFAPPVWVARKWVPAMNLIRFGSRADYDAFARMPAREAEAFAGAHRTALRAEHTSMRTPAQTQQRLSTALGRLADFLGLVGTFALLLGGIGVASAMGAYMAQKRETVAALRCLGATSAQVVAVYLLQAAAMGLAGAAIGAAAGMGVQWILPRLFADLLPVRVDTSVDLPSVLTGVGVGVWIALAFALLPLLATRRVSPLEAIRRRVEPARAPRDAWTWIAALLLAASVAGLVVMEAGGARTGVAFALGIGATLAGLWLAAWIVTRLAGRTAAAALPFTARQGIANLHRPGNQTRVVVLAIGFGVFLLGTLYVTQGNLLRPLRINARQSRANLLMFDVQDEQVAGVDAQLRAHRTEVLQQAAIVPMRIYSINGKTTAQLVGPGRASPDDEGPPDRDAKGGRRRGPQPWAVRREYRSTWRDTLNASETLLQGRFWRPGRGGGTNGGPAEVSLDRTVFDDLALKLGDEITWDVQGVRIATRVTSVRDVDWQRLEPNFFAVFPVDVLKDAPHTWVLLARAPGEQARARVQRDVVARYPNVAMLDLTQVQAALDEVLDRVAAVIQFLAAFSVATGFIVLLGAVLTSRLQRIRESVLLRTLGATRRQIAAILLSEYLTLGLLASLAGIGLAAGAGWALAKWLFKLPFYLPVPPLLLLALAVTALAGAVGYGASREVFRHTPLEALREE